MHTSTSHIIVALYHIIDLEGCLCSWIWELSRLPVRLRWDTYFPKLSTDHHNASCLISGVSVFDAKRLQNLLYSSPLCLHERPSSKPPHRVLHHNQATVYIHICTALTTGRPSTSTFYHTVFTGSLASSNCNLPKSSRVATSFFIIHVEAPKGLDLHLISRYLNPKNQDFCCFLPSSSIEKKRP